MRPHGKPKRLVLIGDAGLKGVGAFAAATINADTRVATFSGRPRWIWDIPEAVWPYTFQVGYDRYVVTRRNGTGWAINHSCEPNCVIIGTAIVTRRKIERDEELTFDYSTDVDWPDYKMPCKCGAASCRGVVRAYRFLPKRLRESYGTRIAPYLVKAYGSRGLMTRRTSSRGT